MGLRGRQYTLENFRLTHETNDITQITIEKRVIELRCPFGTDWRPQIVHELLGEDRLSLSTSKARVYRLRPSYPVDGEQKGRTPRT